MWHDMGHTSNLNLGWDKRRIKAKRAHFTSLIERERRREKEESQLFPSKIYRVPLVDFRQTKNKSSSHRRGVPGKRDFAENKRGEILGNGSCWV